MSDKEKALRKRERSAALMIWMAKRSSYNKTLVDKICRWLVNRATKLPPESDFLRDPLIDNDQGFDPDELEKYQRGEIK
jgi:hypothetical protein